MRSHWLLLGLVLCASTASAQPPVAAPMGALRPVPATARAPLSLHVPTLSARPSRTQRTAIGAAVGVVVGGAVGAVIASERVHRRDVIDHSEDGLVYFVWVSSGAVGGLLLGAVAGLAWPK